MADSSMSYVYTFGGYAAIAIVGYAFYQATTQNSKKRNPAVEQRAAKLTQPEPRKEDSKKKQRLQSFASEASKAKAQPPSGEPKTWAAVAEKDSRDDGVDNREFAKQLAKAQEGKKFSSKTEGNSKKREKSKSVKQSRANELNDAGKAPQSPPAPSTDAEADVETSPAASPDVTPADSTGVADMLEPAAKGPSVLRLTGSTEQKPKQKQAKAPEVVESKKQRQNRKKAQAAKEAREEAEKERKVLEEKQRRTARIAEGRAAKDGSQFVAANGSKSSWTQGAPASAGTKGADTNSLQQPLDTFEKPTTVPSDEIKKDAEWIQALPSEEEQIEKLKNDEDEWSTVKTKSAKPKKGKQESSASSGDDQPKAQSQPAPAARPNPTPKVGSSGNKSFGSFSALSAKNEPADEEEEEEEWDV